MNILMSSLSNKLGIFRKDGVSNVEDTERINGDQEETENEPKKAPERDQPSLSAMNHSKYLFKMESKVDINAHKLNHLL